LKTLIARETHGTVSLTNKKNILIINGSAGKNSANQKLIANLADLTREQFDFTIFDDLKSLPHFDPDLSAGNPPDLISGLRSAVEKANGIIVCTPEYVFSIPSGLKNAIEWCVSTIVFTDKPTGIITASAHGQKAHEELQLIMKTVGAKFTRETTLLIQGIKGKINEEGAITDKNTKDDLIAFGRAFQELTNT